MLRSVIKKLATRVLVSPGSTAILAGQLKGRLLPHSIASTHLAMVCGLYETKIQQLLSQQAIGCQVTYDIGAHVGFFSLLFAHVTGDHGVVIAFEPSATEADRVNDLIQCNRLEQRVTLERMAVCDEVGELTFHTGSASFTGILDKFSKHVHRENQKSVKVRGITLDEYVYVEDNPPPDFIKIDVEAAEASVIRGALRLLDEKRPKMLIEVHGPNPCRDTVELILRHKYHIDYLGPHGHVPVTQADQLRDQFWTGKWTNHLLAVPV